QYQLASVTFNEDGTYSSVATCEGKQSKADGTWKYDGRQLQLTASCGTQRCYDAAVWFGKELVVADKSNGDKVTMKMKKAGDCGSCKKGCDRSKCPAASTCTKQCPKGNGNGDAKECPKAAAAKDCAKGNGNGDAKECPLKAAAAKECSKGNGDAKECPKAAAAKDCPKGNGDGDAKSCPVKAAAKTPCCAKPATTE
ncbi:MAG: hypothetical protein JXA69_14745, partial [Phycisphaerae bacterium]|nr:hypothetical protein [Phycisphaerae bacterium]